MRDPCPSSCGWPTGSTCLPQARRPSSLDGPGALRDRDMTARYWNRLSSAGPVAITGLVFGMTWAQSVEAQRAPEANGLEEVVVTAERRPENLQSVPQTVSVVDAAEALNQGTSDSIDLTAAVPGLQFNNQANSAIPFIRGVGTVNGVLGNEP